MISKCSPHDVYVGFFHSNACITRRTEERVWADPSKPKTNRDERLCTFMWLCVASAWFEMPAGTAELVRPGRPLGQWACLYLAAEQKVR